MSATIRAAKSDGSAVWTLLGDLLCLRHFPRRRPRPRQGGDLVLSGRQPGNRAARHRVVVCLGADAVAGRGGRSSASAPGCSTPPPRPCAGRRGRSRSQATRLIAAFGARLVWTKGGGFIRALQAAAGAGACRRPPPAIIITTITDATRIIHHGHDHHHDHDHVHDEHCGHSHGPTPSELAGPGGWRRGLGAIFAVGIRPCSGAILVLVFALAQGLFWAGIAATFVMGLGTAITVATIAIVAVSAKGWRSA